MSGKAIIGGLLGYLGAGLIAGAIQKDPTKPNIVMAAATIAGGVFLSSMSKDNHFLKGAGIGVAINGGAQVVGFDIQKILKLHPELNKPWTPAQLPAYQASNLPAPNNSMPYAPSAPTDSQETMTA
jgi:hypothetical protein